MTSDVHLLQESTVHLLRDLYLDKGLPVTQAMFSILNDRYPTLESIIATLDRYKNEELVSAFVVDNQELIDQAKTDLTKENEITENNNDASDPEANNPISRMFELVEPYKLMKGVAISEFEKSFSNEISALCNEELVVEITSMCNPEKSLDSWAELQLTVKSRNT